MEIGSKIKQLRAKAGVTQEQLAEKLRVSPQAVSKWETGASMPDIALLPLLSQELGVSIDELFDLTREQKLRRIERRMELEEEFPADIFRDYEEFLQEEIARSEDKSSAQSLLAHLYHHRMEADARRVSRLARESIRVHPDKKDCQWLLCMAEGAAVWDWNVANHARVIDFYKELISGDEAEHGAPLPYYYLIDNLLADHRADEAEAYLAEMKKLPAHRPLLARVYEAHIALARFDEKKADAVMEAALQEFPDDSAMLFEAAQYYARKCQYSRAIELYEAAYAIDEKPRFTDALEAVAFLYQLMGDNQKAAATYDRILESLTSEWNITEEETVYRDALRERNRLLTK